MCEKYELYLLYGSDLPIERTHSIIFVAIVLPCDYQVFLLNTNFSKLPYLEMYFSITGPDMGFIIISMGSAVLSQ